MEYRVLGRTGLSVSRLGLGTMMLGAWGNTDRAACGEIIRAALEAGINLVDVADVYAAGESEEIVGAALTGLRDEVILATKFHNPMGPGPNQKGNSRRWIYQAVDASLRRLGTDWIDIYQVHRPDPHTPIEETQGALTDLVRSGKIRYWGTSTFPAEALVEAHWSASKTSGIGPHTEQPPYSILCRGIERDVLDVCARYGMGVLTWSPLSGGWLTGKYTKDDPRPAGTRAATHPDHFDGGNQAKIVAIEQLLGVASSAGISLTHMALAWCTAHPATSVALIGPRTVDQLLNLVAVGDLVLDSETLDAIDEIVAPGTNVNAADAGWDPPTLARSARRRTDSRTT